MPATAPTAALLDVDGTLVDTTFHHAMAWWRACRDLDLHLPVWQLHRLIGMGSDQLLQEIADEQHDDLTKRWEVHFEAVRAEVRALPGAAGLVRSLHNRGLRVVYATSGREEDVEAMRAVVDADRWVHAVVSSSEVEASKPAPDIFELALERAGATAERAVVVGDTVWDAEAAAACGIACIGVRTGGVGDAALRAAGVVAVYDDAAAIADDLDASPFRALLDMPPR